MPAYNEGEKIYSNLEETISTLDTFGIKYELIVVDDGSKDNTKEMILKAAEKYSQIVPISYTPNQGKGNAIKVGVQNVKNDLVAFVDADLELHPRQLRHFIETIELTHADIVIGSKRHPESVVINYPKKRVVFSKCYNLLVKILFGMKLTDTQPGMKLFTKQVLDREFPKILVKRYAFDLEVLYNAVEDGYQIVEVPLEIQFSREEGGRIGYKSIIGMFRDTLGIFYRAKIIQYYAKREKELHKGK